MKLKLFGITFLAITMSSNLFAKGAVDFVEINKDIVVFSTTAEKTAVSPACVVPETSSQWTINLNSQSGRATYTMLITAMSTGNKVNIETAGDCGLIPGIERAKRVWFAK